MVSWEWIARRRGITIESVIRSGVNTFEAMEQYCQDRDISAPAKEEYTVAYAVVNPPAVQLVVKKPPVSKQSSVPKPPVPPTTTRKTTRKRAGGRSTRKSKLET